MKMFKKVFVIVAAISSLSLTGCSKNEDINNSNESIAEVEALLKTANVAFTENFRDSLCLTGFALEDLNEFELDALYQMREEELMAHDIYFQLYELYQYRVFDQIAKSEAKHAEAVKSLLIRYELTDPAVNHEMGLFNNSTIQELYNTLMNKARLSGVDALTVGATIEDVDIFDLKNLLTNGVDNADITYVFQNLLKGSENHMRAFVKVLGMQGSEYTPQYITQDEFDLILSSSGKGKGNGNGNGNGNGQGNGNGNGQGNGTGTGTGGGNC
ncbi:MAG: hypothetical protein CVU00_05550 [Bacteroidetes bacterium HGW-Bacteroidetes-17]|nr:MAG: hypothetical protein CVU00_05550 [Bacteroidetes bacterium HGW-Bacteroidetes-17]